MPNDTRLPDENLIWHINDAIDANDLEGLRRLVALGKSQCKLDHAAVEAAVEAAEHYLKVQSAPVSS